MDVYRDWLGIQDTNRPLNYYQLLRLKPFEDDHAKIRDNYRKMNAHVRKYASGDYAAQSQALLNELAKAMLCLTDADRKLEYDVSLGRKVERKSFRRTLEEILIANNVVPQEKMKKVKGYADAVGIDLHEAVLQQKDIAAEEVMLAYAESVGLPFVNIEDVGVDEELVPQVNPNTARLHSFVPLMVDKGQLILVSPKPVNPDVEEELRMIFAMPVRSTICTPAEINAAVIKYYPKDAVQLVRKGTSTTAAAKAEPAAKTKAAAEAESVEPLSEEEKKDRLMTMVVTFNFTVMASSFGVFYLRFPRAYQNSWLQFLIIGTIAVAAGGLAAWLTWNKKSR
ncbi:MAG: hypothetical protein LBN39_05385 [Planctomycetaceae bacterium]|jgi:hypothetical protein|nr:hypothetical protein [Planctomycetaceae bacterium]